MIRSDGSGGVATSMTYDVATGQVVIVGTIYETTFWKTAKQHEDDVMECFVAVGGNLNTNLDNYEKVNFLKSTLGGGRYRDSSCWGVEPLRSSSGSIGTATSSATAATYLGIHFDHDDTSSDAPRPFFDDLTYTSQFLQVGGTGDGVELPRTLVPLSMTSDSESLFVALETVSSLSSILANNDGTSTTTLETIYRTIWTLSNPIQLQQIFGDGDSSSSSSSSSNLDLARFPQIRKFKAATGETEFGLDLVRMLHPDDYQTAISYSYSLAKIFRPTKRNVLIVVGSTNAPRSSSITDSSATESTTSTSMDGFLLFINPVDGKILSEPWRMNDDISSSLLYNKDTILQGACISPNEDYLYLVGTMRNDNAIPSAAFCLQYDLATNTPQWTHVSTGTGVQGLMCTATDDAVYMGGVSTSDLWESPGPDSPTLSPDDAFVVKMNAVNTEKENTAEWIRPLDTSILETQDLRREWITGMEMTAEGHLLVLLNSMDLSRNINEVFLVDLHPEMGENDLFHALNYAPPSHAIPSFSSLVQNISVEDQVNLLAILLPITLGLIVLFFTYYRCCCRGRDYPNTTGIEEISFAQQEEHLENEKAKMAAVHPEEVGGTKIL